MPRSHNSHSPFHWQGTPSIFSKERDEEAIQNRAMTEIEAKIKNIKKAMESTKKAIPPRVRKPRPPRPPNTGGKHSDRVYAPLNDY
jgi:hypothetical protein